ncbi:MAG TPA: putative porin [Opitutaceae bacterium]
MGTREVVLWVLVLAFGAPMAAQAQEKKVDPTAMEEVLGILRKEGLIDEATQQRLLAKQVAESKKQSDGISLLGGLEWSGDFRLRYESFYFSGDQLGNSADDRSRVRYRARLGFKKKVSDRVSVGMRLASGNSGSTGDLRSTNVSAGEGGNDSFSPDGIFIDQAWVDFKINDSRDFKLGLMAGKVANPYIGKNGFDSLVFDTDINLEGAYFTSMLRSSETVQLYGTLGGFVIDEDSVPLRTTADDAPSKDQKLIAAQLGGTWAAGSTTSFGLRASAFQFRSLDTMFVNAAISNGTSGGGNLAGAFGEPAISKDAERRGKASIGEVFGYVDLRASEQWPVKIFGTFVRNFSESGNTFVSGVDMIRKSNEDDAWGAGIEIGDAKKLVQLGFAYFAVEANSVVSQFMDSDVLDGFTNREGWIFYANRELVKNVDLRLAFLDSRELDDDLLPGAALSAAAQPLGASLQNADRRRLQADVILKF